MLTNRESAVCVYFREEVPDEQVPDQYRAKYLAT